LQRRIRHEHARHTAAPELAIEDVRRTEGLLELLPEVHEGARRATAKLEFGTRSGQSERGG